MALGKLWNALFGNRSAAAKELPTTNDGPTLSKQPVNNALSARPTAAVAADGSAIGRAIPAGTLGDGQPPIVAKGRRKSVGKREKKLKPALVAETAIAPVVEPSPRRAVSIARPQKNSWTKLIGGRQIGSILDTNLGDASRAAEILQAIVCDAVPTPKYIAIDLFELGSGALTVVEFHQRIRRVGGQPVAIPAELAMGLRQLSRTLGTVDLVLLDGSDVDLGQLEVRRLLDRVTHRDSLVLHRDARGKWHSVESIGAIARPLEMQSRAA